MPLKRTIRQALKHIGTAGSQPNVLTENGLSYRLQTFRLSSGENTNRNLAIARESTAGGKAAESVWGVKDGR
jgi:hypothetical protein